MGQLTNVGWQLLLGVIEVNGCPPAEDEDWGRDEYEPIGEDEDWALGVIA